MQDFKSLIRVKAVEPLEGYMVQITFQNGEVKQMNLEPFLRGDIFAPMREDFALFRQVAVVGSTIGWPNGADIDPYVLYYGLKPAWQEEEEVLNGR